MNENQPDDGWRGFLELCLKTGKPEVLNDLMDLLLTPQERVDIGQRYRIVGELIRKEKPQREISRDLQVCIAKITRGSNYLKTISAPLKQFLEEHFKK